MNPACSRARDAFSSARAGRISSSSASRSPHPPVLTSVALGATARLGTTARFAAHAHGEASGSADLKTPTAKGCKSVKPNAAMAVGQFREAKLQSN